MIVRRHGPSRRICVVAGCDDLPEVAALLGGLPADSYGQAYLVRPSAGPAPLLDVPQRVMICWLNASARPGEEVRTALAHWVAEWGDALPAERPTVWVGSSVRHQVGELDLRCLDLAGSAYVAAPHPIADSLPATGRQIF